MPDVPGLPPVRRSKRIDDDGAVVASDKTHESHMETE